MMILPLFGLALLDSLSAGTFVIPLMLVLNQRGVHARPLAVYFGMVCVSYFMLGVAILFGLGSLGDLLGNVLDSDPVLWVQLAIGVGLAAYGIFAPDPKKVEDASIRQPRNLSDVAMVGLAMGAVVVEAATMVPYLAAIAILSDSDLGQPSRIVVLAVYCLVMILPALVAISLVAAFGERIWPRINKIAAWIERETKVTLLWISVLVGLYLINSAVQQLDLF